MSQLFNMPKLSFIVLSYNHSNYIKECIESILAQSYRDIEIIIVDDHSSDKSVEIIKNIIQLNKTDIKMELISHKRNKGKLACVFDGIKASNGDFVACINAKDKIAKDYALTHIGIHLFENKSLTVCELYEINNKSTLHTLMPSNQVKEPNGEIIKGIKIKMNNAKNNNVIKVLDKKTNFFGGWWWAPLSCAVIRKKDILPLLTFENINNWREFPEKLIFNFLHLTNGSIKIYEPLVCYRLQELNESFNITPESKKMMEKNIYSDIVNFFRKEKNQLIVQYTKKQYYSMLADIYKSIPKLIMYNLTH